MICQHVFECIRCQIWIKGEQHWQAFKPVKISAKAALVLVKPVSISRHCPWKRTGPLILPLAEKWHKWVEQKSKPSPSGSNTYSMYKQQVFITQQELKTFFRIFLHQYHHVPSKFPALIKLPMLGLLPLYKDRLTNNINLSFCSPTSSFLLFVKEKTQVLYRQVQNSKIIQNIITESRCLQEEIVRKGVWLQHTCLPIHLHCSLLTLL